MRKRLLLAVLIVSGLAAAPAVSGPAAAPANAQPAVLDEVLARAVTEDGLPGAVAVVRNGDVVTRHGAGYADVETGAGFVPNTRVRLGSIPKTFVAAAILQLVAEGRVDVDSPIETYLPGRIRGSGIDANTITVRQLLRHPSGLGEYFGADTPVPHRTHHR